VEYIEHNGREYALGCLDRPKETTLPLFETAGVPLIPRSQWKPVDLKMRVAKALNQGSHGACVGFGCTKSVLALRRCMFLPDHDLSPWDLYRLINGGRDAGANIHDALVALQKQGVCDLTLCPSYTSNTRRTAEQTASGALHTIKAAFDCPTHEDMATALQLGYPMPFGVSVTTRWTPGSDGWLWPSGSVRGGHCILGMGFAKHPTKADTWGIPFSNSWDEDWGIGGWGIYPLELINEGYADSWACELAEYSKT
jgi:hypothetical protein